VIVYNLHILRTFLCPAETNPKLIIHSNAVLSFAPGPQSFQVISGRGAQKLYCLGRVKLYQLANRDIRNARKLLTSSSLEQCLRIGATEAPDHEN
jgi:hypothetical protein